MSYCMTESQDASNLPLCKEIGEYICAAYPGYSWHIRIDGGALIIKNMSISAQAAMIKHLSELDDGGKRKKEVVMAAGYLLEAAGLSRRGKISPENAKTMEGLPKGEKFKPLPDFNSTKIIVSDR